MQLFRRSENPNAIAAIFLLVLLAVFAGPNTLPRLLSNVLPFADEGAPCEWLRTAEDLAEHQSLIGRAVANPMALTVKVSPLPTTPDGQLVITITVINQSIGTVPILYNKDRVLVGDNGTSGLGIVFNPPNSKTTGATRQDAASYLESDIRLLGPRQRCTHKIAFPANQIDPNLLSGTAGVTAYYRNNNRGQVAPAPGGLATPIFSDQGLWTGFVQSEPVVIPLASQ
jgi:hypothetical protein